MTWNVRIYDCPSGRWIGCVDGKDETEARLAAISRFNISSDVDFEVSLR